MDCVRDLYKELKGLRPADQRPPFTSTIQALSHATTQSHGHVSSHVSHVKKSGTAQETPPRLAALACDACDVGGGLQRKRVPDWPVVCPLPTQQLCPSIPSLSRPWFRPTCLLASFV